MASSVALVNKDIARHYLLQNLLAPPEAIELTKLYNQMSEMLSKPVKFRNQPMQLHLFYDLLSRYAKHLEHLQTEGMSPGNMPSIPLPPSSSPDVETPVNHKKQDEAKNEDEDDDMNPQFATMEGDENFEEAPQSTPKKEEPEQKEAKSSLFENIAENLQVPEKTISLLQKHDDTFQLFDSAREIVMLGKRFPEDDILNTLWDFKHPKYSPTNSLAENVVVKIFQKIVSQETDKNRNLLFESFPGFQNMLAREPSNITRKAAAAAKKFFDEDDDDDELEETAITSRATHQPKKLKTPPKTKRASLTKRGTGKVPIVHWARWEKNMRR